MSWGSEQVTAHMTKTNLRGAKSGDIRRAQSVERLLRHSDEMTIPHFQRGLVWHDDAVALLLESLYEATPCGSIVLWAPDDVLRHGVPLGKTPRYLVIDGQQRLRSLFSVFGSESDGGDDPGSDQDDEIGLPVLGGGTIVGIWASDMRTEAPC